jgi:hypothetical protein
MPAHQGALVISGTVTVPSRSVALLDALAARSPWLVPLLCGLLSMVAGQDVNWDLLNYHLYNPHALLNGRIGFDLAPGQWQSYFNPTIDVPYYLLVTYLPAWLCAFLMGTLHGLNFPLLLALGRRLLPADSPRHLGFWLAAAGCAGPAYLSGLGNTMGDNLAALFMLGALLIVLRGQGSGTALLAGLVMGLGTGLKLTNAVYALALCVALLGSEGTLAQRLQRALLFGVAVLAGIGISAGHWYWAMWQHFGNPLFPQFNHIFHSPLAAPIGIGDTGWLPKSLAEKLVWPFIFTLQPQRVCELPLRHLAWPLLYVAGILLLAALALGRRRLASIPRPARLLMVFAALSYLLWMNLFSIYRYLVPLELLAPTLCWLVLMALLPGRRTLAAACVALCALSVLSVGNWGHGRYFKPLSVEVPAFAAPAQSLVYIVQAPMGWLVPYFPPEVAFVSLDAGFPESAAWVRRAEAMRLARGGPFYVALPAGPREPDLVRTAQKLERYGLGLAAGCRHFRASAGRGPFDYRLCEVRALR